MSEPRFDKWKLSVALFGCSIITIAEHWNASENILTVIMVATMIGCLCVSEKP